MLDVVRELRQSGMTMVLATHEMAFAREISDLVCFLDGGRIVERYAAAALRRPAARPDQSVPGPGDRRRPA
ncbi:MAG: hypothetical protein R2755_00685 [Acidimicrobiales bacterium]